MRLAGTLELAGLDDSITPSRVTALVSGARRFLPQIGDSPEPLEIWRGLRPCTPDGLPIIGPVKRWDNLTLATGHAMLGLTLATATGELVADMIAGRKPQLDPAPFAPDRFQP